MALEFACEQFTDAERITASRCSCKLDVVRDLIGDEGIDEIIDSASDAVAIATGMRVTGRCTSTVRPCSDGVCGCTGRCACCNVDGIRLPGVDIAITQVKVDGAVIAPELYTLVDGHILARTDNNSWPGWQRLVLADTEPDTFSITFAHGRLPWIARMAATELACDLMSGVDPGGTMKLPPQAVSAIMDGVTLNLDPDALTGFPWMQRLFGLYPAGPVPLIYSPELSGPYTLHVTS